MNYHEQDHAMAASSLTQALFELMKSKPFSEISVTELVRKAGVGRATYYRNYSSKEEILTKYISQIMRSFWRKHPAAALKDHLSPDYQQNIMETFRKYEPLLRILYDSGLAHLYLTCINTEMSSLYRDQIRTEEEHAFLYAYTGAEFNVLFNGYISGLDPDENILQKISEIFYSDYDTFISA